MKVRPKLGAQPRANALAMPMSSTFQPRGGDSRYEFAVNPEELSPTNLAETVQRLNEEIERTQRQINLCQGHPNEPFAEKKDKKGPKDKKDQNGLQQKLLQLIELLSQLIRMMLGNGQTEEAGDTGGEGGSCAEGCECCAGHGVQPKGSSSPVQGPPSSPVQGPPPGGSPVDGPPGGNTNPVGGPTGGESTSPVGGQPINPNPTGGADSNLTKFPGVNDPKLQRYINQLAEDEEGRNLLREAKRRGVRIKVGQPTGGALAHFDPSNNTIVIGRPTMNAGTGMQSLIHELVHAVTPQDGDSQHEEGMANVIANRIAARVQRFHPSDPSRIYKNTLALYPNLPRYNTGFDENIGRVLRGVA